MLDVKQ